MAVFPGDGVVLGTLYGSEAMRAIFDERAWLQRMLDVEAALARVQARLGLIPEAAALAIGNAARVENIDLAALAASTRIVGYPVVGLVAELARAAGPEAGRWTHWGATTQDILDTAVSLQVKAGLALIRHDLLTLARALARQAAAHRATPMAGRTHLQHALPITFGLKCAIWLNPLLGHLERLEQLRPRVELVEFGGAAGTLASLGGAGIAVMEGLAQELVLGTPRAPWHVCREGLAETVGFLGLLCGSLGKFATDIILLAQTEVAEVAEPHQPGRGGSSTMPQKRNPISAEYILAATRGVQALVPVMQGAMLADQERATGPWQAEPLAVPQAFVLAHGAVLHARAIAQGMVVDAARMRRNLDLSGGLIVAESVMMGLAPSLGREAAHHAVRAACDAALAEGLPLAEALARNAAITARLDRAALEKLTDPARYLGSAEAFISRVLDAAKSWFSH
jgi:3-carboxy-cis,cis-muconate cycloisomerase